MKIGIIGGSGLDDPEILLNAVDKEVETPYGKPSSSLKIGKIGNVEVVILARHGRKHEISPSKVNNKANIYALKKEECSCIISTTACGSLRKDIERGDFVILDQFIDFTKHRDITFFDSFENGAKHTAMAEPFDKNLRELLINKSNELGFKVHDKGTVVTIEGPRFSTKAESKMFSLLGADVINMSIAPETILAKEAEIPYAVVALSTDYDCLFDDVEPVSWEDILKVFENNVEKVKKLLLEVIPNIKGPGIDLKSTVRTIPDFPKPGIMFRDITTLLQDKEALREVNNKFVEYYKNKNIDIIVGAESRGFIFGSLLAYELGVSFVPVRKPGKLPYGTIRQEFYTEYSKDAFEIHEDAIKEGDNVLIIDDLLATGGTCCAAIDLVRKLKGNVIGCGFVIELPDLHGRDKIKAKGCEVFSLIEFEGE